MWKEIVSFEVWYQVRRPVFGLSALAFFLMALGMASTDVGVAFGNAPGTVLRNSPVVLVRLVPGLTLLGLFVVTAFVGSAALRDFEIRSEMLFFTKPMSKRQYLGGRFVGSMIVSTLVLLAAMAGLAAGNFAPWQEAGRLGPFLVAPYLFGLFAVALPNLLIMGAIFFAVAIWSRRILVTYLCVVFFVGMQDMLEVIGKSFENSFLGSLLEPSGLVALETAARYWTIAEQNTRVPELTGALLANRFLWLGIGLIALVASFRRFSTTARGSAGGKGRKSRAELKATAEPLTVGPVPKPLPARLPPPPTRTFSAKTRWHQLLRQTGLELREALVSAPFLVLLATGLMFIVSFTFFVGTYLDTPVYPLTHLMLLSIQFGAKTVLGIILVFYSGELYFRERALKLNEVYDALPIPAWVPLASKLLTLWLMAGAFVATAMASTLLVQVSQGFFNVEPGLYAKGLPVIVWPFLTVAVLALFFQVLTNRKLVGFLLTILVLAVRFALPRLGFENHLYLYGGHPPIPYSDLNGYGHYAEPFAWLNLYWSFAAAVLVALSLVFWARGTETTWAARIAVARARWTRPLRAGIGVALLGLASTGAYILYNTKVRNRDHSRPRYVERLAEYERKYGEYRDLPRPRITDVRVEVDIYPEQRRVAIRGRYLLKNESDEPIRTIPITISPRFVEGVLLVRGGITLDRIDLPEHRLVVDDEELGFFVHELVEPLAPDQELELGFEVTVDHGSFLNHHQNDLVVGNGTLFSNRSFFPFVGYARSNQLLTPLARHRHGLPEVARMAPRDDPAARSRSYLEADWIDFETIVSTSIDQTAIAPGDLLREWTEEGRRYFHYKTDTPIINLLCFLSAEYEVARDRWNEVEIEVFYHPGHEYNIDRFLRAAKISLDYLTESFGPYPHRQLRIVEIPSYHGKTAFALAQTIPFSESWAFAAKIGEGDVDSLTAIVAHEIAHQWWNHQVVPSDTRGATMISESLSEYSALMVVEREYGPEMVRHLLRYDLDRYLRGRGQERVREMPLLDVENQMYIHYGKGSLAMYALKETIGEERLNGALRSFLEATAFEGPPYTTSEELSSFIEAVVPPEHEHLIEDLFRTITLFDNRIVEAISTERSDGTWRVVLHTASRKLRDDGKGETAEIPLDDWIEIGVFGEEGVLRLEKRHFTEPEQTFELVVDERPVEAGIDPYNKLIDRDAADNVRSIVAGTSR